MSPKARYFLNLGVNSADVKAKQLSHSRQTSNFPAGFNRYAKPQCGFSACKLANCCNQANGGLCNKPQFSTVPSSSREIHWNFTQFGAWFPRDDLSHQEQKPNFAFPDITASSAHPTLLLHRPPPEHFLQQPMPIRRQGCPPTFPNPWCLQLSSFYTFLIRQDYPNNGSN